MKWKCLDIENEKWNENASRLRSRMKSETKLPRDQDREVKFLENSREILKNYEILKFWCKWFLFCTILLLSESVTFSWQNAKLHTELQNVTDMADISVQQYWKIGTKSAKDHAVLQN